MKKKITKLNLEELEKKLPCLNEEDARAVVGGDSGDWFRMLWWNVLDFLVSRDCAFNSFIYVYNNNAYGGINPSGYQIPYNELALNYIHQYGYLSSDGVDIGIFMNYVNSAYNIYMHQIQGGTMPDFSSTNIIAIPGEGQSLHFVVPTKIVRDANEIPTHIEYYDPTTGNGERISVSDLRGFFDIDPIIIDSPIDYPYDSYNYPYNNYSYNSYNYYS